MLAVLTCEVGKSSEKACTGEIELAHRKRLDDRDFVIPEKITWRTTVRIC